MPNRQTLSLVVLMSGLLSCTTTERHESEAEIAAREAVAAQAAGEAEAARIPPDEARRQISQIASELLTASALVVIRTVNDPRATPERRKKDLETIRAFVAKSKPCSEVLAVRHANAATAEITCAGNVSYTVDMKTGQVR